MSIVRCADWLLSFYRQSRMNPYGNIWSTIKLCNNDSNSKYAGCKKYYLSHRVLKYFVENKFYCDWECSECVVPWTKQSNLIRCSSKLALPSLRFGMVLVVEVVFSLVYQQFGLQLTCLILLSFVINICIHTNSASNCRFLCQTRSGNNVFAMVQVVV